MSDPTDNALAAIASILDQTTTPPEKPKSSDTRSSDKDEASDPAEEPPASIAMPPPLPSSVPDVSVEAVSIVAEPPVVEPAPTEQVEPNIEQAELEEPEPVEPVAVAPEPSEPEPIQPIEANGYSKSGPGPMAALRFRWTVREDGAQYYVDETVGEGSNPLVNGPMDRDAAIKFVDDREAEARQRFEHFKHEIVSRTTAALQASRDRHEA